MESKILNTKTVTAVCTDYVFNIEIYIKIKAEYAFLHLDMS